MLYKIDSKSDKKNLYYINEHSLDHFIKDLNL